MISEEISITLKTSRIEKKGPQLFLAVQVEEELNIVHFKGVLKSDEFMKLIKNKKINNDEKTIKIKNVRINKPREGSAANV